MLVLGLACADCGKRGNAPAGPGVDAGASTPDVDRGGAAAPSPTTSAKVVDLTLPDAPHRFQKMPLGLDQLAALVASAPQLARIGAEVVFFEPGDGTYLTRSRGAHEDFIFTSQPVVWTPKEGVRVLVLTGHGKESSFVAAWMPAPGGGLQLESAFVLVHEMSPIALAYKKTDPELMWTTCWQCPGEGGHVTLHEDGHIVIVQD